MSGIIHSLFGAGVRLFGNSPTAGSANGNALPRTGSRARELVEAENVDRGDGDGDAEDDHDDDGAFRFSAFGNNNDVETQPRDGEENGTQPPDACVDVENAAHAHGESMTSSGYTTAGGQSLATQMTATAVAVTEVVAEAVAVAEGGEGSNSKDDDVTAIAHNDNDQVDVTPAANNDMHLPANEAEPSPLDEFFAHLKRKSNEDGKECESENNLAGRKKIKDVIRPRPQPKSLKEWKKARKTILRNYLERRLVDDTDDKSGEEDGEYENDRIADDGDIGDDCSFSSDILDEPFGSTRETVREDAHNDTNNDNCGSQEEEKEEEHYTQQRLETQSQSPLETQQEYYGVMETQEERQPESQEEIPTGRMKRKFELFVHTSATQPGDKGEQQLQSNKRRRTANNDSSNQLLHKNNKAATARKRRKGLMWDGRFESIPYHKESTTMQACHKVDKLDLHAQSLDLSLCRVLRVWDIRSTKRIYNFEENKRMSMCSSKDYYDCDERADDEFSATGELESESEPLHSSDSMGTFEYYEDDGPLNTIYQRVFSMELGQLVDEDDNELGQDDGVLPPRSPSVTNIATSAFIDGKHHLEKTASRRRRHRAKRIRVYFYNVYADVMARAYCELQRLKKKRKKEKKANANDTDSLFLMSLANVPALCILPRAISPPGRDPYLQQYINNPFGDEEFGALSPYCVCIGDKSTIRRGDDREPLHFHDGDMEIRLVEAPSATMNNINDAEDAAREDMIINMESIGDFIRGGAGYYFTEGEESILVKRSLQMRNRISIAPQPGVPFQPEEEEETSENNNDTAGPAAAGAPTNRKSDSDRGSKTTTANDNSHTTTAASRSSTGEATTAVTGDIILRPHPVEPMSNLLPLLQQKNMNRLPYPITTYGVVLGFSPPSLTKTKEWTMSIVMIDDTLPLSTPQDDSAAANEHTSKNKSLHVPSVTLVLFSKDKSKLPMVRSAGVVLCCEKVVLQRWSGDPQLCARRNSNIVVLHPKKTRCPGDGELHDSADPNEWATSDHDKTHTGNLHWPLVNCLWRWGQRRLAAHPTMSPNCRLSIEKVGADHRDNNDKGQRNGFEAPVSGDLTAIVTAVMAIPEHLRRRDTPRGYLRLWDGTGPSRSDQLPSSVTLWDISQPRFNDPPQKVLVEIEKIIQNSSSSNNNLQSGHHDNTIQAPIALCGRVINTIIWEEQLWNLIQNESIIEVGSFVRLRNVNDARLPNATAGPNCLSIHAKSSLTPLPYDAYEVKELLKDHDSRLRRGVPPNPTSAILANNTITTNMRGTTDSSRHNENNGNNSGIASTNHNQPQEIRNDGGFSTIKTCLCKPPPATFTVQFEVSHTIPACDPIDANGLKDLFTQKKPKDGKQPPRGTFRFALHIKDASSEIDVLCLGEAASNILGGIKVQDIIDKKRDKCQEAAGILREMMSPGSICEGKIKSVLGKDGKLYFVLKSMFCITAEEGEEV